MPVLLKEILQADQKKAVEYASGLFKDRRSKGAIANTKFYDSDHWQDSAGWIGAKPLITATGASQTLKQIQDAFVSENVIAEVNDRHVGGILGREVNWDFVPENLFQMRRKKKPGETLPEKDKIAQDVDESLTQWWNEGRPKDKLKEGLTIALNEGKATLRLFIPPGLRDDQSQIEKQSKLGDALDFIHVDVVYADKGGIFIDESTQRPFGLYVNKGKEKTIIDVTWMDRGVTFLQVLSDDPELVTKAEPYDLGGRLWMYELTRRPLITEQVRSNQKSLNLALTMMMRNVNLAGNLERVIMNAERPRTTLQIPDPSQDSGYRQETINGDFAVGPGATNMLTGLLIKDNEGKIIGRANPNISYRDPVAIDTFVGTREQFYTSILGQTQQIHALISKDATASGVSREQARAEFEGSLKLSKEVVDDAGRWMLESALRLAATLMDQTKTYADLRCDFNSIIETGKVSPEERNANREDVKGGLMSKETAMARNNVEDTDAEMARIAQEQADAPEPVIPPSPKPPNGDSEVVR